MISRRATADVQYHAERNEQQSRPINGTQRPPAAEPLAYNAMQNAMQSETQPINGMHATRKTDHMLNAQSNFKGQHSRQAVDRTT